VARSPDTNRPRGEVPFASYPPSLAAPFLGSSRRTNAQDRPPILAATPYHDLHTALLQTRGATPAGFNRAVYERLKPGGFYVIVDHVAAAGTGTSHAESLHRIEPAAVREEVETAGFVLDAESTVLANKSDPHSIKVFDPSIKGETDRFAYRFVRL
jgi:predicted methyltransferase